MIHTSYPCPNCQKTSFPNFVLNDRKGHLVVQCPNPECLHIDNTLQPKDFTAGVAALDRVDANKEPGWQGRKQVVVDPNAEVTTQTVAATSPPTAVAPAAAVFATVTPAAQPPRDVVAWLEERTLALALEEARLTNDITSLKARIGAAKSERKRLEKMLAVGRRDQLRTEPMLPVDTTALKN
jgi:hypothetical protein